MKRAIYLVPEGTRYNTLTPVQQAAIDSVGSQFVLPMLGTIAADGYELVDGLTEDNFDPSVMPSLGLEWQVLGMWSWDGVNPLITVVDLNTDVLLRHLPAQQITDENGEVISTSPPVLHMPHNWAGWPSVI